MTSSAISRSTGCPILTRAFAPESGSPRRCAIIAALSIALLTIAACHSYHIDSTIVNRTGAPVQLLEVDYPYASFGADTIAAGSSYHYRFVVRGSGPIKISYTGSDHKQVQITGLELAAGEQGRLRIVLLPGGKAQFLPEFTPQR